MKQFIFSLFIVLLISCQELVTTRSVLPDFSPEHTFSTTSYLKDSTKNVVIRVRNFGGPNTAPVVIRVTKMVPVIGITFDEELEVTQVGTNTWNVNNFDWTMEEQATRYVFTSKPGVVITDNSYIGLSFTGTGYGGANWTTSVVSGTGGGDSSSANNIKVTGGFQVL